MCPPPSLSPNPSLVSLSTRQAYLILDEFILGGEIQETSKKVSERGGEREGQGWMESEGGGHEREGVGRVFLFLSHNLSLSHPTGHPRAPGRAGPDRNLKEEATEREGEGGSCLKKKKRPEGKRGEGRALGRILENKKRGG